MGVSVAGVEMLLNTGSHVYQKQCTSKQDKLKQKEFGKTNKICVKDDKKERKNLIFLHFVLAQ